MRQLPVAAAAALLFTACGGGGGGAEPPPSAASVSVSASGSGALPSFGDTRELTAAVRDANGNAMPNATVSWSATPVGVVTLSATTGQAITASAAGNGSATVTAASGTVNGSATVDVAQRLASVAATPNPLEVSLGGTRQIVATARDARANAIAGASGFTFGSDNTGVATVSGTGLVSGIANGTATVTVALTRDGASANAAVPVTVAPAPATAEVTATSGNAFTPSSVEIAAGGTVTWTFQALHNVSFVTPNSPEDIANRSTGSVSRTFPGAGTFSYTCTLHAGMNGQVVVR